MESEACLKAKREKHSEIQEAIDELEVELTQLMTLRDQIQGACKKEPGDDPVPHHSLSGFLSQGSDRIKRIVENFRSCRLEIRDSLF